MVKGRSTRRTRCPRADPLHHLPFNWHRTNQRGVEMFQKTLDEGQAGDNVGCLLRGVERYFNLHNLPALRAGPSRGRVVVVREECQGVAVRSRALAGEESD